MLHELEWTKLRFHASEPLRLFLLFTNGSQYFFCTEKFDTFRSPYSRGCRAALHPFSSTLFIFLYFAWLLVLISRPSDLTSISSVQRSRLSSAFFVVPSERRRTANCLPRCTMGGGRWRGRRKWHERCPKLQSIQLFEPPPPLPRFLRVRLRVREGFKAVGRGRCIYQPAVIQTPVCHDPSSFPILSPHLVGNGEEGYEMQYWNISGTPAKCHSAVESSHRTLSSRRRRRGEGKEWRSVLIEEQFCWQHWCKRK